MILHTVNKSPLTSGCLATCLRFVAAGDAIVLLEDGVYAASRGLECGLIAGHTVYAMAADVEARGMAPRLREGVGVIDYDEFVNLCASYSVIKNWS